MQPGPPPSSHANWLSNHIRRNSVECEVIQVATGHMKEEDEKRKKGITAQIQVTSLLPVTPDWKVIAVEWTEKTFSQQGVTTATEEWKAIVNIGIYTPTEVKDATVLRNPLGVFIVDYHWQKKPGKEGR